MVPVVKDGKFLLNTNTLMMNIKENQEGFSSLERETIVMKPRDCKVATALSEKLVKERFIF